MIHPNEIFIPLDPLASMLNPLDPNSITYIPNLLSFIHFPHPPIHHHSNSHSYLLMI